MLRTTDLHQEEHLNCRKSHSLFPDVNF